MKARKKFIKSQSVVSACIFGSSAAAPLAYHMLPAAGHGLITLIHVLYYSIPSSPGSCVGRAGCSPVLW